MLILLPGRLMCGGRGVLRGASNVGAVVYGLFGTGGRRGAAEELGVMSSLGRQSFCRGELLLVVLAPSSLSPGYSCMSSRCLRWGGALRPLSAVGHKTSGISFGLALVKTLEANGVHAAAVSLVDARDSKGIRNLVGRTTARCLKTAKTVTIGVRIGDEVRKKIELPRPEDVGARVTLGCCHLSNAAPPRRYHLG